MFRWLVDKVWVPSMITPIAKSTARGLAYQAVVFVQLYKSECNQIDCWFETIFHLRVYLPDNALVVSEAL